MNKCYYESYIKDQFKKLKPSKYGYSLKIFDGFGNSTYQMELTPQKASLILKLLKELRGNNADFD